MTGSELLCPECGEPAQERPPTDLVPWSAHGMATPRFSHLDGSSLCPVVGERGYEPAAPVDADGHPVI